VSFWKTEVKSSRGVRDGKIGIDLSHELLLFRPRAFGQRAGAGAGLGRSIRLVGRISVDGCLNARKDGAPAR